MTELPMKRTLTALALGVFGLTLLTPATALQGGTDTAELQKRYEEKVSKDWLKKANWSLELEDALARAKKEGKPVFAYFTRSYSP